MVEYYGKTISTYERKYVDKFNGEIRTQNIFIVSTTKQFLYGNSWNGRWKCSLKTGKWYRYVNYEWHSQCGEYTKIEESRGN